MIREDYKVSIITVVYNGAKTIEQTIQSVLQQSYKNIEYIVIDGLSTDGTQKIVEKYLDSIICFVSEKDEGIYDAMNKGIRKATGDIVGIINSDDWYAENAVENIVKYFEQNKVDLIYGKLAMVYQNGKVKIEDKKELDIMWYQMAVPHPTVFVKRNVYEKFGGFNTKYKLSSDYDFLLRLYSQQAKFGYVDKVLAYFRVGGTSTIREKEMIDEGYAVSMAHIKECPDKESIIHKIEEKYHWSYWVSNLRNETGLLYKLSCQYFHRDIKSFVIFGAGLWGKRCYEMLIADGAEVSCFADNDAARWGMDFLGVKIINPQRLHNMEAYVLIAVKDSGDDIKYQMESMGNERLRYVSIGELASLYYTQFA